MPRYAPIVVQMYACDEVQQKRTVGYKSEQESKINAHSHNTANISAMQIWTTKRSQINGTHTHTQSMNVESAVREKLVTPKRSRKQIINYFCRRWRLIFPIFFLLCCCSTGSLYTRSFGCCPLRFGLLCDFIHTLTLFGSPGFGYWTELNRFLSLSLLFSVIFFMYEWVW